VRPPSIGRIRTLRLSRHNSNPIITPRKGVDWEVNGTFNPSAASDNEIVHMLYRATDENRISRLGYARIVHGTEIAYRSAEPVFGPSAEWEEFGCEDPRITRFEGTYYVTYTAYSRRGTRLALASTQDFVNFTRYGLVGPDRNDKDAVLFPERIRGKIAILHRLRSRIQVAYFESIDSLTKTNDYWSHYMKHLSDYEIMGPKFAWERRKVGVGPPPIKTDLGWLVIYHGVSIDHVYRAGAVLLDLDNPLKVTARTKDPILEPVADFETQGVVPNVVFPDGAVVQDKQLWVYYGGADKVCCSAFIPLAELLDELRKSKNYSLKEPALNNDWKASRKARVDSAP